ncbi:hypothetical protein [Spiroplasma ixodetis]|uniref:hypothetical protein n=1 Tax=Spiroplasma ixodetis TaxID=2141 RepID=UPI002574F23B|nr:hypothetical protein [Spiroplasma ixodetis]WJG69771.1 hypothetical protein SIXOD_v1c07250 [Spiroplasma ixodetis Y32]
MADLKDCLDKNVEENIKFISSKIIEKKAILFLGAGFSANFGFPLWKKLLSSIIEKIENEFQNLDSYCIKELNNLKSMVQNNFDLSRILDNLKNLLHTKEIKNGESAFL